MQSRIGRRVIHHEICGILHEYVDDVERSWRLGFVVVIYSYPYPHLTLIQNESLTPAKSH